MAVVVVNPFIKDSDMTVFRRKLTSLSLFGLLALTAGAAGFGLDSYFEARQQELLAFITAALAGTALFRDFWTAQVLEKPHKLGR